MNKDKKYLGIDISKDVFDVCDNKGDYYQFKNNISGFKKLLKLLDIKSICVMEATGYYHVRLAYFLLENEKSVSVINPLKIKRYIQMQLSKIKTDKSDSKMIQAYAASNNPSLWLGESKTQQESLQLSRLLSVYTKQQTQLKNKVHGESVLGYTSKDVLSPLNRQLKSLKKEMVKLEERKIRISGIFNIIKNDPWNRRENSFNVIGFYRRISSF